jgi:hypothetical protein
MTENGTSNRRRYFNSILAPRSLCCLVYSVASDGETADRAVAFLKGVRHTNGFKTSALLLDSR